MRILVALAILALLSVSLAGCATGDKERYPNGVPTSSSHSTSRSTSTSTSRSDSASSTRSGTGGLSANHPPTATIALKLEGSNATFSLNGTDEDHDTLVWDLAFGDGNATNGTVLPTSVHHLYNVTGNLTAVFTVTDGHNSTASNLTVALLGASGPVAVFTGTQTTPSNPLNSLVIPAAGFCGASCCASFATGQTGVDCVFFKLDPAFAGHLFTGTADSGDPDLEIWASCSPTELFSIEGHLETGPESGTIPKGAGCVVMWAKSPPDVPTLTFTVL